MTTTTSDQTIIEHTRQWLEKAVIGLNLCPFAKAPYIKNRVRIVVSHAKHTDGFLEDLDRELLYLASVPTEEVETSLLIHPDLYDDFLKFNDILDFAEQAVLDNDLEGIIQIAPFHPQFQFAGTDPNDISNYTNRSPYPTLHLIREESISKAVEAIPDAAQIFERNIRVLEEMGHEGWQQLKLAPTETRSEKG